MATSKSKAFKLFAAPILGVALSASVIADPGVTENSVLLGQSCALKGAASALGNGMMDGLNACFAEVNAAGGINGRTIELKTVNDGYEPDKCTKTTTMLIEKAEVFALIGGVGTPTAKVAVPIAEEHGVPFIAPFTGAEFLRNPHRPLVWNLRGSYYQEMERLAQHLVDEKGFTKVSCFYQNDGYGKAGLSGIEKALAKRSMKLASTGTYERNTVAVASGLTEIASGEPEAVIMVGAYKACAAFIKQAKGDSQLKDATFCNISFVGTKALHAELGSDGEGVMISQVVPFPWDTSIPVVGEFHKAMASAGKSDQIGFIALEGYLAGKMFCDALATIDGEPTRSALTEAIANLGSHDFGGVSVEFGATDSQGMDMVFLTQIQGGEIKPVGGGAVASVSTD